MLQEKYQKIYDVPTELVHNVTNINVADRADAPGGAGSLLPPVSTPLHRGGKLISFKIDKWGFKDDIAKVRSPCCMRKEGGEKVVVQVQAGTAHHISYSATCRARSTLYCCAATLYSEHNVRT